MLKIALAITAAVITTGCAQLLDSYSASLERSDPCIVRGKAPGYQSPTWCGASAGYYSVTRDWRTGQYLTETQYYYSPR